MKDLAHEIELFSRHSLVYIDLSHLVGIDIDHASRKLDLRELVTNHIPLKAEA